MIKNFFRHLHMINRHRFIVFKLCLKCGLFWRGLFHDLSKYSFIEFWEGVKYYNGRRSPISKCREN
ncbi:MAG: catalase, partial [Clostridia bacterium]|nr:catalase [Clostridia bacterium]